MAPFEALDTATDDVARAGSVHVEGPDVAPVASAAGRRAPRADRGPLGEAEAAAAPADDITADFVDTQAGWHQL